MRRFSRVTWQAQWCLWAFCFSAAAVYAGPRETLADKKCSVCHLTWMKAGTSEALGQAQPSELDADRIREKIGTEVGEDVCYGCHDGFVKDSRKKIWVGKAHSVAKAPSPKVSVPAQFPLDLNGRIYCGTCHSPHSGSQLSVDLSGRKFLRIETLDSLICKSCHVSKPAKPKEENHPVEVLAKAPVPEEVVEDGGRLGSDPRKVICQSCHAPHGLSTLVRPVEGSSLCTLCHRDKLPGSGGSQDSAPSQHPVNVKPKVGMLEDGSLSKPAALGSDGTVICSTCHSPHQGRAASLIVVKERTGLCAGCHKAELQTVQGTKHDLPQTIPQARNARGETATESGTCGVCHLAHGRARTEPAGMDAVSGVCVACHQQGGTAAKKLVGLFSHPVGTAIPPSQQVSGLPVLQEKDTRLVVCASCHDPHREALTEGNQTPPQAGAQEVLRCFLRKTGQDLCLACHADKNTLLQTKHNLSDFEKLPPELTRGMLKTIGACAGCHRTHNAAGERLWFANLALPSDGRDADSRVRHCLSCHRDEDWKRIDIARGHPIGQEIRPEYLPALAALRAPEAARTEDGRERILVCETCHVPHGEVDAQGKVKLFIGGREPGQELCVGCHEKNKGVIGSPHDFRSRAPEAYQPDKGRSLKYGVCAGCHANHEAGTQKRLLWFTVQEPRASENPEDMLCLYCHGNAEIQRLRPLTYTQHPAGAQVRTRVAELAAQGKDLPPELLPEGLGDQGRRKGYEALSLVRCVTCHDNHRWIAEPAADPQAAVLQSTEMSGFLRGSSVAQNLCSMCHGVEALYRYRFFHERRPFRKINAEEQRTSGVNPKGSEGP